MSYWDKLPGLTEEGKKFLVMRARRQATFFGLLSIAVLIGFVYTFVRLTAAGQKIEDCQSRTILLNDDLSNQKIAREQAEKEAASLRTEFENVSQ